MAIMLSPGSLLLDTNVLIHHMARALNHDVRHQLFDAFAGQRAYISVITRIEILAWKGHGEESLRETKTLIRLLPELALDNAVIEQTIQTRKTFGLKLPDAVIAATALVHGLQLMTANTSDFKRVTDLNLISI